MEIWLHTFLTSALDRDEWFASFSSSVFWGNTTPGPAVYEAVWDTELILPWTRDKFRWLIQKRRTHVQLCCDALWIKSVPNRVAYPLPARTAHTIRKKQSSSRNFKLAGWGSGGRRRKKGGSWYEGTTCFMAPDVGETHRSQIHRPLEPAQSL